MNEKYSEVCKKTREITSQAFLEAIKKVWGTSFSEKQLKDLWLKELGRNKTIFPSGWYSPPPDGIAVLIGNEGSFERLDYHSLRSQQNWPQSDIFISSQTGIVFIYASPVDKKTGIIGDFGMTLYRGRNQKIINQLKKVIKINRRTIKLIKPGVKVKDLYHKVNEIIKKAGLVNKVVSITNPAGIDIGHSVPGTIKPYSKHELAVIHGPVWAKTCQVISQKRIFISRKEDYIFKPGDCFTIEPSLVNPHLPELPRILFHTIVSVTESGAELLENFDKIFKTLNMDYMLE